MALLRDAVLPLFDNMRAMLDDLGFRRYDIILRTKTWPNGRPGAGTPVVVDTPITLDGRHRVGVKQMTSQDVIVGGKYQEGDFRIGAFTPQFASGGVLPSFFDPPSGLLVQEVYFRLTGPGMESGQWFKLIDRDSSKNFGLYFQIRSVGTQAP